MGNVILLQDGIINIYEEINNKEKVVDARELHEFLEVGRNFGAWMKARIDKYEFNQNEDYILTVSQIGKRKNVIKYDYYLTMDMAKELAMVENNEKGRQVRKYFIETEKKYKKQMSQPPTTLEALYETLGKMVEQERKMKNIENKVVYLETEFNKETVNEGYKSTNNIARKLNLFSLKDKPHQRFVDAIAKELKIYNDMAGYKDEYVNVRREKMNGGTIGTAIYYSYEAISLIERYIDDFFKLELSLYVRGEKKGYFKESSFVLNNITYKFNENTYNSYTNK